MTSRLLRVLGVALLLLAISPVTAPFSTCDLSQLLGNPVQAGGPVVQAKAAPDEPVPTLGSIATLLVDARYTAARRVANDRPVVTRPSLSDPLRI